jgi:membrane protease YdiL (CAAX protease family)
MKKVLRVALVVLLVVIGLPVLMPGMAAPHCEDCSPAAAAGAQCAFVVLVALAYVGMLMSQRLRVRRVLMADLLRAAVFDRPPQLAA